MLCHIQTDRKLAYNIFVTFLRFPIVYRDKLVFSIESRNRRKYLQTHKAAPVELFPFNLFFRASRYEFNLATMAKENKRKKNGMEK